MSDCWFVVAVFLCWFVCFFAVTMVSFGSDNTVIWSGCGCEHSRIPKIFFKVCLSSSCCVLSAKIHALPGGWRLGRGPGPKVGVSPCGSQATCVGA